MPPKSHDPREHIRGLHQILISDKKRIGFLFGAGTSFATGIPVRIPAVAEMTRLVTAAISKASKTFECAIKEIEKEMITTSTPFHIESLLSTVEAKRSVVGEGSLNGLDGEQLKDLSTSIKKEIKQIVSAHEALTTDQIKSLAHTQLAGWISRASRHYPVEIFTTNYDYLLEFSLEHHSIPYFDGFTGSFRPFYCPEAVEDILSYPDLVKLWKLHGSLNWQLAIHSDAIIRSDRTPDDAILIYPSHLKYDSTKKQPYVGLIDRLYSFLQQDDAILITCGFSFGDNHINERIATSLRRGGNSHVIALYFDEFLTDDKQRFALEDASSPVRRMASFDTAGKMSVFGRRHAVIGGQFGPWRLRSEPNSDDIVTISSYFDEDAAIPPGGDGEQKGTEEWSGLGTLKLPDFAALALFLSGIAGSD